MIKLALLLVVFCLCSCTFAIKTIDPESWKPTGVAKQVRKYAGDAAIDCGFHDLLTEKGRRTLRAGFTCMRKAKRRQQAFIYGTYYIPIDSYAFEILMSDASGEYWHVVYDRMLGESDSQLWVRRCKTLEIYKLDLDYRVKDCKKMPFEEWL